MNLQNCAGIRIFLKFENSGGSKMLTSYPIQVKGDCATRTVMRRNERCAVLQNRSSSLTTAAIKRHRNDLSALVGKSFDEKIFEIEMIEME